MSTPPPFVPENFAVPKGLSGDGFRLEPLGPEHNEADHVAWMSSIDHIRATPGFPDGSWPPLAGMSLEDNQRDLRRHVLDDNGQVVGCVYIYPLRDDGQIADVQSWVRADRSDLDEQVHDAVIAWLSTTWPFGEVRYR